MKYIITAIIIVLLCGCLVNVPYGYFQFARLMFFAGFLYLAYLESAEKRTVLVVIYIVLALFLQPFAKVHFVRATWNLIDESLAALLFVWAIIDFVFQIRRKGKLPY